MAQENLHYPALAPYLGVKDSVKAIEFYKEVFGAKERFRLTSPDSGKIAHSELEIGGCLFMLADEFPGYSTSPEALGGTPVRFHLAVENADAMIEKARKAGATVLMEPTDQFYGMRSGTIRDPFGHEWMVQHQIEKVDYPEMEKRFQEMCKQGGM